MNQRMVLFVTPVSFCMRSKTIFPSCSLMRPSQLAEIINSVPAGEEELGSSRDGSRHSTDAKGELQKGRVGL